MNYLITMNYLKLLHIKKKNSTFEKIAKIKRCTLTLDEDSSHISKNKSGFVKKGILMGLPC